MNQIENRLMAITEPTKTMIWHRLWVKLEHICRFIKMWWGSALTATLMITTKIVAETSRQHVDAERHPNIHHLQTALNESESREKKNQTQVRYWTRRYKPTMTRCGLKTSSPDKGEITSRGQITEVIQGRSGRGQHHPLALTMETKKERASLQPIAIAVLTSIAGLPWILGSMTLIFTTRRMQSSSSSRSHSRRPGQ